MYVYIYIYIYRERARERDTLWPSPAWRGCLSRWAESAFAARSPLQGELRGIYIYIYIYEYLSLSLYIYIYIYVSCSFYVISSFGETQHESSRKSSPFISLGLVYPLPPPNQQPAMKCHSWRKGSARSWWRYVGEGTEINKSVITEFSSLSWPCDNIHIRTASE